MKTWTENGREPSKSERQSVDVGVIVAREFENAKGDSGDKFRIADDSGVIVRWPTLTSARALELAAKHQMSEAASHETLHVPRPAASAWIVRDHSCCNSIRRPANSM